MQKIIVGVSGGADSMALLDMLRKQEFDIVVAHVNYQVRSDSHIDEKVVRDYCHKYNLELEVLADVKYTKGNFQAFAREVRYSFMVDLAKKNQASAIYVAHHQDDLIETYLMQVKRKSIPTYYGLNKISEYQGVRIKRVLLDYPKAALIKYCLDNNIKFTDDASNFKNVYTRNLIRNTIVNKLSDEAKIKILNEIKAKNNQLETDKNLVLNHYQKFKEQHSLDYLSSLDDEMTIKVLRHYFSSYDIYNTSNKEMDNILNFIKSDNNAKYHLATDFYLIKDYDKLFISQLIGEGYSYTFAKLEPFECEHFKILDKGCSLEGVLVSEADFPITVRNFKFGDKIEQVYGTKKVSRFFIDNKIPTQKRKLWPIVLNAADEIILVPQLGPNVTHYSNNPNMFVVK